MLLNLTNDIIHLQYDISSRDIPQVPSLIQDIYLPPSRQPGELHTTEAARLRYGLQEEPRIDLLYVVSASQFGAFLCHTTEAYPKRSDVISLVTDKQCRADYFKHAAPHCTADTRPWEYATAPVWERIPYMRNSVGQLELSMRFYADGTHPESSLWYANLSGLYGGLYRFAETGWPCITFYHGTRLYTVTVSIPKPAVGKRFSKQWVAYNLEPALEKAFAHVARDVAAAKRKYKNDFYAD